MFLVDSHCHLNLLDLPRNTNITEIISHARENQVKFFLNVCTRMDAFALLLKTAECYSDVVVSIGLHPNETDDAVTLDQLLSLGNHPKVVAIGETGLDYFRSEGDLNWQRDRFRLHIKAATLLKKPLIIHTRAARADTLAILQEENAAAVAGVMHCFTEDWATAKAALDLGFYISFSGIVTFKNAKEVQEVALKVPLDRLLIETDCPYLAPNPHRGQANQPAYLRDTALFIANLRGISLEAFAEATTHNFFQLFKGATKPHV